jgi:hypothetical protein
MIASHELFGFMPSEMALEIIEWAYTNDKPLYKTVLKAVADIKRVRPVFLERQPRKERHQTVLASLMRPNLELTAANLIRTWLLKKHTPMLAQFLEALGIPHKDGVVDDLPEKVDDEKLKNAIEGLLQKYPKELVAVYLHAFNTMNDPKWKLLEEMLNNDPRLQF